MGRFRTLILALLLVSFGCGAPATVQRASRVPTLASVSYGEVRKDRSADGRELLILPSPVVIRASITGGHNVQWRVFVPVGDDQEPLEVLTPKQTAPGEWVVEWKPPIDRSLLLNLVAEVPPGTPHEQSPHFFRSGGKEWVFLAGAVVRGDK